MPTVRDTHVDAILTNISIAYKNASFIADKIFPIVPVKKESDKYFKYGKERFNLPETIRAPKTRSKEIDWAVSTDNYSCEEYALSIAIDDRERENADNPIDLDTDSTEIVTDILQLGYEKRVADIVTNAANYPVGHKKTLAGTSQWSDTANSTPVRDVEDSKKALEDVGLVANTIILPNSVFHKLKENGDIIERIKYSERGIVTLDLLKSLFDVENIYLANSKYNTANPGQSPSLTDVWTDNVWIGYVAKKTSLKQLTFGYTFRARKFEVRRWREDDRHSDVIEPSVVQDEKLVAADAGYLIQDALA
jgi:hypothetical protein